MESHDNKPKSERKSDDASNVISFSTHFPVIIEIKVKPDQRFECNETHFCAHSPHLRSTPLVASLPELTAADFSTGANNNENVEFWQIFERKPSDQFNRKWRDKLSESLRNVLPATKRENDIENLKLLLSKSDGEENDDNQRVLSKRKSFPDLSIPLHSAHSSTASPSLLTNSKMNAPSKSYETFEHRDSSARTETLSLRTEFEKTGTFLSAKNQSSQWIESIDTANKWMRTQPSSSKNPAKKLSRQKPTKHKVNKHTPIKQLNEVNVLRQQSSPLDYRRIISALKNSSGDDKCKLLEALRTVCCQFCSFDSRLSAVK